MSANDAGGLKKTCSFHQCTSQCILFIEPVASSVSEDSSKVALYLEGAKWLISVAFIKVLTA
jgi:hypothetical protein